MSRFVFMMLDGVGVGELPDAAAYGDTGSDTLGNLARTVALDLPNLRRLGLGNIIPIPGMPPVEVPRCLVGRLAPHSAGKDTTVGHWEHMGLVSEEPFPTYPHGFPEEVLGLFRERIGRGVLGNKPASGTAIIEELGRQHLDTGWPIVYTSADSVFQIATHVDVVPLDLLYRWCEIARELLAGPHAVARVIARPFAGPPGSFSRTTDRRDFSLAPPSPTYLDLLQEAGVPVLALGKISEVFVGRGVTAKLKVGSNDENLALLIDLLAGTSDRAEYHEGLLFTNLVDFDMAWGHRNDPDGFARGLEAVDKALPRILELLGPGDRLIVSADHGVDPTTVSTDHSREYVPLLLYPRPPGAPAAVYDGLFSDTGATIFCHLTGRKPALAGESVDRLRPARGWRRYTAAEPAPQGVGLDTPGRVGQVEALAAAEWLQRRFGPPPAWAVMLGSGLAEAFAVADTSDQETVSYREVPHWRTGSVPGHPGYLDLISVAGEAMAVLRGRAHGYEGFDLSEIQLPIRTLAAWGVGGIILSSAAGAVSPDLAAGDLVVVREIIDLQQREPDGAPTRILGSDLSLLEGLLDRSSGGATFSTGVHAAVPGPHYETAAEVAALRAIGADCVSMSLAAETRAAHEEHMIVVALAVISNAGPPSHEEVLAGAASAAVRFASLVESVIRLWRPTQGV